MKIELRHGSGGEETGRLIHELFENILQIPYWTVWKTAPSCR